MFGIIGNMVSWNLGTAILLFGVNVLYYVPMILALKRERPDKLKIIIVNILLGWTIVGWVVALRWALKDPQ